MTQHEDATPLRHMRDHVAEAIDLAPDRSRDDLGLDRVFALALTRLVEIVGEAAARVSEQLQDSHPEIPCRQIIGTRNRLNHGCDVARRRARSGDRDLLLSEHIRHLGRGVVHPDESGDQVGAGRGQIGDERV